MYCGSHSDAPRWVCVRRLQLVGVIVLEPSIIHSLPLVKINKSLAGIKCLMSYILRLITGSVIALSSVIVPPTFSTPKLE